MIHVNKTDWSQAPVIRVIFAIAGVFVMSSILLALYVHSGFLWFGFFVGGMQLIFALTGWCPMALILQVLGLKCALTKK